MKPTGYKYLLLPLLMAGLTSCYQMRVEVDHIPSNTPANADIYITGEFNSWDPGDNRYILEKLNDSVYYIDLPRGVGELEYKFTRGDWSTVEKDNCGYEIENRRTLLPKRNWRLPAMQTTGTSPMSFSSGPTAFCNSRCLHYTALVMRRYWNIRSHVEA